MVVVWRTTFGGCGFWVLGVGCMVGLPGVALVVQEDGIYGRRAQVAVLAAGNLFDKTEESAVYGFVS